MPATVVSWRWSAPLIAAFVGVTALTWSWSAWVRGAANATYWVLVVVLGVLFLVLAVRASRTRRWLFVAAGACALLGVTALWSVAPEATIKETVKFGAIVAVAALVGARIASSREAGATLAGALAYLAPAAIALTSAVALAAIWTDQVPRDGGVSGFFNGSNALSIFLSLTFAFTLAHRFVSRRPGVALALSGVVAFVATLSGGRSGLMALLLVVAVLGLATRRWAPMSLQLGGLLIGAALAIVWAPAVPTVGEPLAATEVFEGTIRRLDEDSSANGAGEDESSPSTETRRQVDDFLLRRAGGQSLLSVVLAARDEAWVESARILRERPLEGHGFGTGNLLFDRYDSRERFTYFVGGFAQGVTPHNSYLQAALELGIPGGIAFLAPLILTIYAAIRSVLRRVHATWEAAFFAALAATAFSAFFDSTLTQAGALTLMSWISIAGVLGIALRRSPAEGSHSSRVASSRIAADVRPGDAS